MTHTLHRLFWRIHFWAGLISAPIVIFAALTGLLYALSPQIEARLTPTWTKSPRRQARP